MQQFKSDVERLITKVNARDIVMSEITLKEIICLLEQLLDAILCALPDSTPTMIKNLLSMIIGILKSICKML